MTTRKPFSESVTRCHAGASGGASSFFWRGRVINLREAPLETNHRARSSLPGKPRQPLRPLFVARSSAHVGVPVGSSQETKLCRQRQLRRGRRRTRKLGARLLLERAADRSSGIVSGCRCRRRLGLPGDRAEFPIETQRDAMIQQPQIRDAMRPGAFVQADPTAWIGDPPAHAQARAYDAVSEASDVVPASISALGSTASHTGLSSSSAARAAISPQVRKVFPRRPSSRPGAPSGRRHHGEYRAAAASSGSAPRVT